MKDTTTQPLKKEGDLVYEPLPVLDQLEAATVLKQFLQTIFKTTDLRTNDLPVIV
jgi:hypothetical protein